MINNTDPILESEHVLSIVRPFVSNAGEVIRIDEQGGSARTYHIDGGVTLKVLRPNRVKTATYVEREVFLLKQLEVHGIRNVPKSLGYGKSGIFEYNCMTTIPGSAVRFSELTPQQREDMLYKLGETLYQIHHINLEPFYESGLFFETHTSDEDIRNQVWHYFNLAIGKIAGKAIRAEIDEAREKAEKHIAKISGVCPKMRHADPSDEHTFVENGKYSGVIDFGDAYISHPAFDLRRWPHADRPALMRGYLSAGRVEDSFLDVCENIFAVENILSELILSSKAKG